MSRRKQAYAEVLDIVVSRDLASVWMSTWSPDFLGFAGPHPTLF
jgi:hypothetical protein